MSRLFRALMLAVALLAPAGAAGHASFAHAAGTTIVAKATPKVRPSTTLWT